LSAESGHNELQQELQRIRDQFESPEHINNNPDTAPGKRIKALITEYDKVIYGSLVALEVGLEGIRQECPLFDRWVEALLDIPD
jgi:hypothetical protein